MHPAVAGRRLSDDLLALDKPLGSQCQQSAVLAFLFVRGLLWLCASMYACSAHIDGGGLLGHEVGLRHQVFMGVEGMLRHRSVWVSSACSRGITVCLAVGNSTGG